MEGLSTKLEVSSEITFQTETASHIRNEFLDVLDDLTVGINIKRQELMIPATRGKRLQETTLEIIFDTAVSFKNATTNLNVTSVIGAAFDTEEDRSVYLNRMGQTFAGMSKFSIVIDGVKPPESTAESPDGGGGVGVGVIIRAATGRVVLVGLLLFVFLCKRKPVNEDSIRSHAMICGSSSTIPLMVLDNTTIALLSSLETLTIWTSLRLRLTKRMVPCRLRGPY